MCTIISKPLKNPIPSLNFISSPSPNQILTPYQPSPNHIPTPVQPNPSSIQTISQSHHIPPTTTQIPSLTPSKPHTKSSSFPKPIQTPTPTPSLPTSTPSKLHPYPIPIPPPSPTPSKLNSNSNPILNPKPKAPSSNP